MTPADGRSAHQFSVVVEMENATTVCWEEVGQTLRILADQIAQQPTLPLNKPQVFLVHPGPPEDSAALSAAACEAAPRLHQVADLEVLSVPGEGTTS